MAADENKANRAGATGFILMIGDEGAILVQMQKKRVVRRLFAQSPDPNHSRAMNEAFNASPKAPITILIDLMDQSYMRQTLPPVSFFSVGKIVKRRMAKDFSADDITGFLILDRDKKGRKDWNYLMVSLADSPLLQKWITFVVERPNPFRGMGLIPLEAQSFLLSIEKILLLKEKGKDAKPSDWQILVNYHKVGGFRQIVLHNGKLIFTRMAQPIGESMPDVIAGNIEQEMTNTVEYLKRLGLQGAEAISVIIIASEDIKKVLDAKNIKAGAYHFFTPYEIANLLSINDAAKPEDQFGDVVISAFIGKRKKMLLPLNTAYTKKLQNFSRAILSTKIGAVVATLAILAWAGTSGVDIMSAKQELEKLTSTQASLRTQVNKSQKDAQRLPQNITMFSDVQIMAKTFNKRLFDPLTFVSAFVPTLHKDASVATFHWTQSNALAAGKDAEKRQISVEIETHLIMPMQPQEIFISNANEFINRIKTAFAEFDVSHSELPGILSENEELKTVIDDTSNVSSSTVNTQKDNSFKITVSGPVQKSSDKQSHH